MQEQDVLVTVQVSGYAPVTFKAHLAEDLATAIIRGLGEYSLPMSDLNTTRVTPREVSPWEEDEYLTPEEVCWMLKIKRHQLYALTCSGRIPHYKVGRFLRFKRKEIEQWMTANKGKRLEGREVAGTPDPSVAKGGRHGNGVPAQR